MDRHPASRFRDLDDRFDRGNRNVSQPSKPRRRQKQRNRSLSDAQPSPPKAIRPPGLDDPYISRRMDQKENRRRSSTTSIIQEPPRVAQRSFHHDESHQHRSERSIAITRSVQDLEAYLPAPLNDFQIKSTYLSQKLMWSMAAVAVGSGISAFSASATQLTSASDGISGTGSGVWVLMSIVSGTVSSACFGIIREIRHKRYTAHLEAQVALGHIRGNAEPRQRSNPSRLRNLLQALPEDDEAYQLEEFEQPTEKDERQAKDVYFVPEISNQDANPFNSSRAAIADSYQAGPSHFAIGSDVSQHFSEEDKENEDPNDTYEGSFFGRNLPRSDGHSNLDEIYDNEEQASLRGNFVMPVSTPSYSRGLMMLLTRSDNTEENLQKYSISPSHSYLDMPNAGLGTPQQAHTASLSPPHLEHAKVKSPTLSPEQLKSLDSKEQRLAFEQARGAFSNHGDSRDSDHVDLSKLQPQRSRSALRANEVVVDLNDGVLLGSPQSYKTTSKKFPEDFDIIRKKRQAALDILTGVENVEDSERPAHRRTKVERQQELESAAESVRLPVTFGFAPQRESLTGIARTPSAHTSSRSRSRHHEDSAGGMKRNRDFQIEPSFPALGSDLEEGDCMRSPSMNTHNMPKHRTHGGSTRGPMRNRDFSIEPSTNVFRSPNLRFEQTSFDLEPPAEEREELHQHWS